MSLADHLATLRERAVAELDAVDEYVRDTERLWRLTRLLAITRTQTGPALFDANLFGGPTQAATVIDQARPDLVRLAAKSQDYVAGYLAESTFQRSLDIFEAFVADLLTAWLVAHPDRLGERDIKLFRVLRSGVDTVVAEEAAHIVYATMKDGPRQWFQTWTHHTKLTGPLADQTAQLVEAKATRDLLVHNRGVVNAVYLKKAGTLARGAESKRIEVPEPYRHQTWVLLRQLVTDLSDAVLAKTAPDLPTPAPPG